MGTSRSRADLAEGDLAARGEGSRSGRWTWLVILVPVVLFARVGGFEFLEPWDDGVNLLRNPGLNPPSLEHLLAFWIEPYAGLYAPVSYSVWSLEAALFGLESPGAFHLVNLALHVLASVLVFRWLVGLVPDARAAALGALAFAVHPLAVGTFAWVTETRGLLAAVFGLGALVLAGHGRDAETPRSRLVAATVLLLLALLSKPMAVAVTLVALMLELWGSRSRTRLVTTAGWIALALATAWVNKALQPDESIGFVTPLAQRPAVAADAIGFYAAKTAWPGSLAADYARSPESVLGTRSPWIGAAFVAVLLIVVQLVPVARRFRPAAWSWLAALSPTLGFVPFLYQQHSTVADRYAYLALVAVALAFATALRGASRPALVVGVGVLLAWSARSFVQSAHWRDARSLFEHTVEVTPRSAISHANLATALHVEGDAVRAEEHYARALELEPNASRAHFGLGLLQHAQGRLAEAERSFLTTTELEPGLAAGHYSLGLLLLQTNRDEAALAAFEEALRLDPDYVAAHTNTGVLHARAGRTAEARASFERALALSPDFAPAREGLEALAP